MVDTRVRVLRTRFAAWSIQYTPVGVGIDRRMQHHFEPASRGHSAKILQSELHDLTIAGSKFPGSPTSEVPALSVCTCSACVHKSPVRHPERGWLSRRARRRSACSHPGLPSLPGSTERQTRMRLPRCSHRGLARRSNQTKPAVKLAPFNGSAFIGTTRDPSGSVFHKRPIRDLEREDGAFFAARHGAGQPASSLRVAVDPEPAIKFAIFLFLDENTLAAKTLNWTSLHGGRAGRVGKIVIRSEPRPRLRRETN
jgi:hypothetical protein